MDTKDTTIRRASLFRYSIVVCTKNRPREIGIFLENIRTQKSELLNCIVIVDGSPTSSISNEAIHEFYNEEIFDKLVVLRTGSGKPTALNLGMDYLRASKQKLDAVVFIDDDISFRLADIERGIDHLELNRLCGLSPSIINEGDFCLRKKSRNKKRILFYKPGALSRGGYNSWVNYRNIDFEWQTTDWLPGGTSIYDWSKVKNLQFCEQLENPILMGYALGDDVDFSIKAGKYGELGCLQTIQVIHSSPASSYRSPIKIAVARGKWRAHLVTEYPDKFSMLRVILGEIMNALWLAFFKFHPITAFSSLHVFLKEFYGYQRRRSTHT